MLSTIVSLVPVAIAAALSTVPVSVMLLILLSPDPRRGAVPFLVGTVAGSLVIVGMSAVGLHFLPVRRSLRRDEVLTLAALLLGLFLIGYAVFRFVRSRRTDSAALERIAARFRTAHRWEFTILGLGLNLRPKAILLAVTAGALISLQDPSPVEATLLVAGYVAAAQSTVILPIAFWLHSPERAGPPLAAAYGWLRRNGSTITTAAMLAVGLFLAGYSVVQLM
jgi:threonine/homoserine/homoserine lactone efflux protein